MLEAVGAEYYATFFEACDRALRPGGRLSLQVDHVSRTSPTSPQLRGANWIQTYIFPGGLLPSLAAIERRSTGRSLLVRGVDDIAASYVRTLAAWRRGVPRAARRRPRDGLRRAVHPDVGLLPRDQRGGLRDRHHAGPPARAREGPRLGLTAVATEVRWGTVEGVTADLVERHRERLDAAIAAAADHGFWSALPRTRERTRRRPRTPAGRLRGLPRQAVPDRAAGHDDVGRRGAVALRARAGHHLPRADADVLLPAMHGRHPRLARRRRGDARGRLRSRSSTGSTRARTRSPTRSCTRRGQAFPMAFQAGGPHAQDRGPGGGRVRAGRDAPTPAAATWEKPQGKRPPLRMLKRVHRSSRAASRCSSAAHLSHLERLPGPVREPRDRQPGPRQAARDAPCCRSRSRSRSPARCWPRPASPDLVALTVERPARASAADPRATPRDPAHRLHGSTEFGDLARGPRHARPSCSPRSPASTASSSTPPTTTRACCGTSPSRSPCTAARCAPRPRTCSCLTAGSSTDEGHRSFDEVATGLAARSTGCSAIRSGRPRSSAGSSAPTSSRAWRRRVARGRSCSRRARSSTRSSPTP